MQTELSSLVTAQPLPRKILRLLQRLVAMAV